MIKNTLLVNLFAGPGTGKSTICAEVFSKLKWAKVDCEMVTEYAKDIVWEESFKKFDSQIYIFAKQYHRINRVFGKVDVIITDSPLLQSTLYVGEDQTTFKQLIVEEANKFNSLNFRLIRTKEYNPNGRTQTEDQAKAMDVDIKALLIAKQINYEDIMASPMAASIIVNKIQNELLCRVMELPL